MEDLLRFILEAIVQKPDKIKITEKEENGLINLEVWVDKEDMGRVIGKSGKIIKAIRGVLRIKAIKEGKRLNLTLVEQ